MCAPNARLFSVLAGYFLVVMAGCDTSETPNRSVTASIESDSVAAVDAGSSRVSVLPHCKIRIFQRFSL